MPHTKKIDKRTRAYRESQQSVRASDPVNPNHYKNHPSGIECIVITEHFNFNMGNAIKYIWRADETADPVLALKKAAWYIERELKRRG